MLPSVRVAVVMVIFHLSIVGVNSSLGDQVPFYKYCVMRCNYSRCTAEENEVPFSLRLFYWSCLDDCEYTCMWETVEKFLERSWRIPQFYGKWPFVRFLGIQEPASAVFSVFNFISHFVMIKKFRKEIKPSYPLYKLWHMYAFVCLNAWFWSTVFHCRDVYFTELMDYFCAFSMVLFSLYSMIIRMCKGQFTVLTVMCSLFCCCLFIHHISYLTFIHFDYGYNMRANILIGAANVSGWLIWCLKQRHKQPYVWRCAVVVILGTLFMLLELADFPPILWTFDAHSLWHLSTSFLPILFYKFLIDDCKFLKGEYDLSKLHEE